MTELETMVEQLVAQQPASDHVTLSDMEELVKTAGRTIEAQVMHALVEAHEAEGQTNVPFAQNVSSQCATRVNNGENGDRSWRNRSAAHLRSL